MEMGSFHLGTTIVSIAVCDDYFAIGCIDDTVKVWYTIYLSRKSYVRSLSEETLLQDI